MFALAALVYVMLAGHVGACSYMDMSIHILLHQPDMHLVLDMGMRLEFEGDHKHQVEDGRLRMGKSWKSEACVYQVVCSESTTYV